MTGLSDRSIRAEIEAGRVGVDPFDHAMIQPASIDVRLDRHFLVPTTHNLVAIDPYEQQDIYTFVTVEPGGYFVLHPGSFVLASTFEQFAVPDNIYGRVEGKSSLGRLGLVVHSTAGFIDPGFCGHITLELSNAFTLPIKLWPGMKIAQMSLSWLDQPAERPYGHGGLGSKYAGQRGPTASMYWKNPRPEGF